MHKPSYNEIPQGFGFTNTQTGSGLTPTDSPFGQTLGCMTYALSNPGSVRLYSGANTVTLNSGRTYGVGAYVGIDEDRREAYTFQISGLVDQGIHVSPFIGFLESTPASWMTVRKFHKPGMDTCETNSDHASMTSKGFARPSTLLSSYANVANVTGLFFGVEITNFTASNLTVKHEVSVDVNRWDRIDNELISVVQ